MPHNFTLQELNEKSLDELKDLAKQEELEGRSGLNKAELAEALAASSSSSDSAPAESDAEKAYREDYVPERAKENEEAIEETGDPLPATGHDSEASDPDNPLVEEALADDEVYQELTDEEKDLSDLALDASGPLNLESPYGRAATGAVSEEQAKEQEAERAKLPENFVGDVPERVSEKFAAAAEKQFGDSEPKSIDPADYIDFPPAFSDEELERGRRWEAAQASLRDDR